jgi:hypothetical protein
MTQRHASLDAWMHTLPPVPNIPGARGHSRRAHHHRHHPVAGAFVGMLMLSAWLLLLELWALEVTAWAALWACCVARRLPHGAAAGIPRRGPLRHRAVTHPKLSPDAQAAPSCR